MLHLVGDMVGLLDAIGEATAVIAGHDWGAPVAWHSALLRPDRFRAVIALSVPFRPRGKLRPTSVMPRTDDAVFYQLHFQTPGVAEAEMEHNVRGYLRGILLRIAGEFESSRGSASDFGMVPKASGMLALISALGDARLPDWLSEADLELYTSEFSADRPARGLELVPQHRPQLGTAGAVRRRPGQGPGAVHRR